MKSLRPGGATFPKSRSAAPSAPSNPVHATQPIAPAAAGCSPQDRWSPRSAAPSAPGNSVQAAQPIAPAAAGCSPQSHWRHKLRATLASLSLTLLTATILVLGGWGWQPLSAAVVAGAEAGLEAALSEQARQGRLAGWSEALERAAAELRWVQPKGTQGLSAQALQARVGDLAPLALGDRVLAALDALGTLDAFEAELAQDWRAEAAQMRAAGLPSEVVERHDGLLAELSQRVAQLRARLQSLRLAQQQRQPAAASVALVDLAGWFGGFDSARGFRALGGAQLPIQVLAASAPEPDLSLAEGASAGTAAVPQAQPANADLEPTLDAPFTPEIVALAQQLGTPVAIRNWVYDHIAFHPDWGSVQGAPLTLLNRRGNAFDSASLLIALLRARGIAARYARGVIELPVAQAQNWLDAPSPEIALDLLQKGGVPSQAVIQGGRIQAIRLEHVWVEAHVDFLPSRGAVHRVPDQWVPMDVAYKQFDEDAAVPWAALTQAPREALLRTLLERLELGPARALRGFDFDLLSAGMAQIASDLADGLNASHPPGSTLRLQPQRRIRPIDSLILEGSLPFVLRSSVVLRYSELPGNLRPSLRLRHYGDLSAVNVDNPLREVTLPLVRLGHQRLAVRYLPASAADAAALALFTASGASSMPLGQINVVAQLRLGEEELFRGPPVRMGTQHYWRADLRDLQGQFLHTEAHQFAAGSDIVFVANLAGVTAGRVERETAALPDAGSLATAESLYFGGLMYWLLHDHQDDLAARAVGGRTLRAASIGAFAQPLQVSYFFGIPRTGWVSGRVTDVKTARLGISVNHPADRLQVAIKLGAGGSQAEGATWPILAGSHAVDLGISTSTLLKQAIDEGQPLYQIERDNLTEALAALQLSADAEHEIRQSVLAGWIVVAPERELQVRSWRGAGYVVIDPVSGSSLQRVEGGFAGGIALGCIQRAVSLEELARLKILKRAGQILQTMPVSTNARQLALGGLQQLYGQPTPPAGVLLPILASVSLEISVALAVAEVNRWLQMVMAGAEQLTPEDLAQLGIASLEELPCSQGPGCPPAQQAGGSGSGAPLLDNPIWVGLGAKWQSETDYAGSGSYPLRLQRHYLSIAPKVGHWLGAKWSASYFQALRLPPAADGGPWPPSQPPPSVLLQRADGTWFQYTLRHGVYTADGDIPGRLLRQEQGGQTTGWLYTDTQDQTEHYSAQGRLQEIRNRAGQRHELVYDTQQRLQRVRDAFGRELQMHYDPQSGRLSGFTDPQGRRTDYQHDALGNLAQVRHPDGSERRYHYEDLNHRFHLTGISDERGVRVSTWHYDHRGRVREAQRAGGVQRLTLRYGRDQVEVVDAHGGERTYRYQRLYDRPFLSEVSALCQACGSQSARILYDTLGRVRERVDFKGTRTTYQRDARGLVTLMVEAVDTPEQRSTQTLWHAQWHLPLRRTEAGAQGNLVTTYQYDPQGNLLQTQQSAGALQRTWTYTWDPHGQMTSLDGPRTDVADIQTRSYDAMGNLASTTDALGHMWQYSHHDADGKPTRMVDPNGQITDLTYHPRGWLLERAVRANADGAPNAALDAITSLEYEPYGDIQRVIQPDDSALEYCRDPAHRITAVVQTTRASASRCAAGQPIPGSEAIVYTLDAAGNRVREEVRDGSGQIRRLLARQYNQLGQLRAAVNAPWADQPNLDDPAVKKTRYTYDPNGNQDLSTDPLDRVADNDYDPLNRLIRSIQDQGSGSGQINATVRYEYDARDHLRKVIDPKNLSTEYVYDGLGNQTELISPDTGSTTYTYDSAGNRKTQTDARGVQSLYNYDALNRLVSIAYPADPAKNIAFVYDQSQPGCAPEESYSLGRLSRIDDASGSTVLCHDRRGNLKRKVQSLAGQTLSVQYRHDRADRLTGITYPSGLEVHTPRDAQGRVQQVQLQRAGFNLALVNGVDWLPFGPIKAVHFGHGETLAKDYDHNYWPQAITSPAVDYQFSTDVVGNIVAIDSTQEGGQRFAYDRLDRLESVRDVNQALIESYTYDATGNRTSHTVQTASGPQTVTYGYPSSSHRLEAVDGQPRTFDPAGNTLSGIPTYDGAQAVYDVRNRLSEIAVDPSQVRQRNNYNGRGERVLSARPQTTPSAPPLPQSATDWTQDGLRGQIYDESGQLLSTLHGGSELRFEEVIWLDNTPIARVLSNASGVIEVHAIHSDHLNTPRALTHAQAQSAQQAGTVVWRWQLVASNPNPQPGLPASNTFGALMADADPDGNGSSVRFDLRFPGQQYDGESGLQYNYFRDYEAGTGRYVESDPIGLGGGVSTYEYGGYSPLLHLDPYGLKSCRPCGVMSCCLAMVFSVPEMEIAKQKILPNNRYARLHGWVMGGNYDYAATTRPKKLRFTDSCEMLWSDHWFVLHEYAHLMNQWATGRMTRLNYVADPAPWENEANNFADSNMLLFLDCLSKDCGAKLPCTSIDCES